MIRIVSVICKGVLNWKSYYKYQWYSILPILVLWFHGQNVMIQMEMKAWRACPWYIFTLSDPVFGRLMGWQLVVGGVVARRGGLSTSLKVRAGRERLWRHLSYYSISCLLLYSPTLFTRISCSLYQLPPSLTRPFTALRKATEIANLRAVDNSAPLILIPDLFASVGKGNPLKVVLY